VVGVDVDVEVVVDDVTGGKVVVDSPPLTQAVETNARTKSVAQVRLMTSTPSRT
jgi:hypothetical protein